MEDILFGDGFRCEIENEEVNKNQWYYMENIECVLSEIDVKAYQMRVRVSNDTGFALVTRSAKSYDINTGELYALKVYP